jgi:hypothetical protein
MRRKRRLNKAVKIKYAKKLVLAIALFFIAIVILVLVVSVFSGSKWDGKSSYSYALPFKNGDVLIVVSDPTSSSLMQLLIPKNTLVDASNQLGKWKMGSIYSLDTQENKKGELLKATLVKTFHINIDGFSEEKGAALVGENLFGRFKAILGGYKSDIAFKDRLKLAVYAFKIRQGSRMEYNLAEIGQLVEKTLPDGELGFVPKDELSPSVLAYFSDAEIAQSQATIEVINKSGQGGISQEVAKTLEVLGGRVMSIRSESSEDIDCIVVGRSKELTAKVASIFGCSEETITPQSNFDIQLTFGKIFASRY